MSVLVMATALSLSGNAAVLPQYSQNELNEMTSVIPIVRKVEELDWSYNSTFASYIIDQGNVFYNELEFNDEHEDDDYGEDIQLQSFAKSSIQVKIKVKKLEKLSITV